MTGDSPATFGWATRLKFGLIAAAVAWFVGWIVSFPFELSLAWRYVDGNASRLPEVVVEGIDGLGRLQPVHGRGWIHAPGAAGGPGGITALDRALASLPVPAAGLAAILSVNRRMGLLNMYHFRHPHAIREFFFSAPNFFVITFALVVVWVYSVLAQRRLRSA